MLIFINRKIFNDLFKDKELVGEYIMDILTSIPELEDTSFDHNSMAISIYKSIKQNEKLIKKYGIKKWSNYKYSASKQPPETLYTSGSYLLHAFDWTPDDNGDFDYSWVVAKIL